MADGAHAVRKRSENWISSNSPELMKTTWLAVTAFLFLTSPVFSQTADYDRFGGWSLVRGGRTGFFHVEIIKGLLSPKCN